MRIAIYDFDGTITTKDTLPLLLKFWSKMGYSFFRKMTVVPKMYFFYIFYKLRIIMKRDVTGYKFLAVKLFLGLFKGMKKEQIENYLIKCADMIDEQYYRPMIEQIKQDKEDGYVQIIISGAFDTFIAKISQILGCDFSYGTKIQYENGIIDIKKPLFVTMGANKAIKIKESFKDVKIDWENSKSYADSFSDLEILKIVGNPIAVKPEGKLRKLAIENGWEII